MNSVYHSLSGLVALAATGAAVILLVLWVQSRLANPVKRQAFDEAIKLQLTGSELDLDTALHKDNVAKLSPFKDWFGYWNDLFVRSGQLPADPATPGRAAIASGLAGMAIFWIITSSLPLSVVGMLLGPFMVRVWSLNGIRKRSVAMEKQLPSLLTGLRAHLQAGSTPQTALYEVAKDLPSPLGDELRALREDLNVSTPLEIALGRLAGRVPSREMQFLIASIEIAVRSGTDLDPQLKVIQDIVEQRTRIRQKLRSAIAQVKPTQMLAYGATPLMFVITGLRNASNRAYWFGHGMFMLVIAAVIYSVGVFVIRMMIKSVEKA